MIIDRQKNVAHVHCKAKLEFSYAQCKTHTTGTHHVSYETLWVMLTGSTSSIFFLFFFLLSEFNPICFIPLNSFQDVWCIRCCKLQFVPETPFLIIYNKDEKKFDRTSPPALLTATWGRQLAAKLQAAIIIYHNSQWTCQRSIFNLFIFIFCEKLIGRWWRRQGLKGKKNSRRKSCHFMRIK